MLKSTNQNNASIEGSGNKIIGGDDKSQTNNYYSSSGKLSSLFEKLKASFDNSQEIEKISDDLKRYTTRRDTIGLEQKLNDAGKSYLYEDFAWLKQEFHKKLVYYQNYEPAQEIFAFILAIVLEKYIHLIKPMLRDGVSERVILSTISKDIVKPILDLIEVEV
ncbi:hypothetical protein LVD17_21695 [Fulvivirga ulvae]|uniref:ABC-three component system protein n=1 Tax=Fulvivirga ulvae TaxID=2904245 RepID=UPI001F17F759|nr:ABC-three component system protein [Fulvivirga ulvae]UII30911.1 hypothetical protein LVD17_21695 [Fulvivirga ulvae]